MNIGILIESPIVNPWSSGVSQNPYFLYKAIENCGFKCVFLTKEHTKRHKSEYNYIHINNAAETNLSHILCTFCPDYHFLSSLKKLNCKIIYLSYYNKFADDNDVLVSSKKSQASVPDLHFLLDEIWHNPQHSYQNQYLSSCFYNENVYEMPYLWEPYFIQQELKKNKKLKENIFYKKDEELNTICIFESNSSFTRNCTVPLHICERAFTSHEVDIKTINVFNCKKIRQNQFIMNLFENFQIYNKCNVYFNNRWTVIDALSRWRGIIINHQLLNNLNYLLLECLYLGFPILHNSTELSECGYFYEDFNVDDGAIQLKIATKLHGQNFNYYNAQSRNYLNNYSSSNTNNLNKLKDLLNNDLRRA
tara:strand:- start:302 stop:1390 length:1089 start_codon:yes stop_codon:yes gene_type:complete